jgi:hypothetical protein
MGRVYTASFVDQTLPATNPFDVFEILAPATATIEIISANIAQKILSGDTNAEMLPVIFARATASGSVGATNTPAPHNIGHAATGATVEERNTTIATTLTRLFADTFNLQAGFYYEPLPRAILTIPPSGILVLSIPTAGTVITSGLSASITFEEMD